MPLDGLVMGGAYTGSEASITAIQATVREFIDPTTLPGGYHVSTFGGFTLDHSGDVTTSQFNVINKPTETGAEEVSKLQQNFAANAFVGYDPINGFNFIAQDEMPTAPVYTLYDGNKAYAEAGKDLNALTAQMKRSVRSIGDVIPVPNPTTFTLWPGTIDLSGPIISHKADTLGSRSNALRRAARPNNWSGDVLSYSFEDAPHHHSGHGELSLATLLFADRLTSIRALIEIETDMNPVMQRGQVVELVSFQQLPQVFADLGLSGIDGNTVLARVKTCGRRPRCAGAVRQTAVHRAVGADQVRVAGTRRRGGRPAIRTPAH